MLRRSPVCWKANGRLNTWSVIRLCSIRCDRYSMSALINSSTRSQFYILFANLQLLWGHQNHLWFVRYYLRLEIFEKWLHSLLGQRSPFTLFFSIKQNLSVLNALEPFFLYLHPTSVAFRYGCIPTEWFFEIKSLDFATDFRHVLIMD